MDPTHRPRLLIDIEVWEYLSRQTRKEREVVEGFLRQLSGDPRRKPDGEDTDEVGRSISLFVAGPFVVRVWQDAADQHLKVLQITRS